MKSLTSLLLGTFLVSLFALVAPTTQAAQIDGGIAAEGGGKVFFRDFQTGETKCVTEHLPDAVIKPPYAVSENGKLMWMTDDGKIHTCVLPLRSEHIVKRDLALVKDEIKLRTHDFELFSDHEFNYPLNCKSWFNQGQRFQNQKPTKFTVSPLGTKLSFELDMKAVHGYTLVPPEHPLNRSWFARNPTAERAATELPMYIRCEPGYFHGIMVAGVSPDNFLEMYFRCGNSYEYPGTPAYRSERPLLPGNNQMATYGREQISTPQILGGRMTWNVVESCKRFSYTRNACLAAWSKDDQMLAVAYTVGQQVGQGKYNADPTVRAIIELRSFEQFRPGANQNRLKPGVYEIYSKINVFKGLAWTPKGDLTIQTEDKIYRVNREQISRGIAKSSVVVSKNSSLYSTTGLVAENNTFQVELEEVAYDVHGTKLCWISDYAFIIRGDDGVLYLHNIQNGGGPEKLLPRVPEDFFYCKLSSSPLTTIAKISGSKNLDATYPGVKSGNDRVFEQRHGGDMSRTPMSKAGDFVIGWSHGDEVGELVDLLVVCPSTKGRKGNVKAEISFPKVKSLDEIEDPSVYEYKEKKMPPGWRSIITVRTLKMKPAIVKCGDSFIGLQVSDFSEEWMDFQWKSWPKVATRQQIAKAKSGDLAKADLE